MRDKWQQHQRKVSRRLILATYCVVVEGQTEKLYFDAAKVEFQDMLRQREVQLRISGRIGCVRAALNIVPAGNLSSM